MKARENLLDALGLFDGVGKRIVRYRPIVTQRSAGYIFHRAARTPLRITEGEVEVVHPVRFKHRTQDHDIKVGVFGPNELGLVRSTKVDEHRQRIHRSAAFMRSFLLFEHAPSFRRLAHPPFQRIAADGTSVLDLVVQVIRQLDVERRADLSGVAVEHDGADAEHDGARFDVESFEVKHEILHGVLRVEGRLRRVRIHPTITVLPAHF